MRMGGQITRIELDNYNLLLGVVVEICSIALPEQQWPEQLFPYVSIAPMLTENVSWVLISTNVIETTYSRGYGFTDPVK